MLVAGKGETGKGREEEGEADYPGEDVVELVNLRGDQTTAYKLADGTYMDRIERRFTYNGTDTWTDEDGIEWNVVMNEKVFNRNHLCKTVGNCVEEKRN